MVKLQTKVINCPDVQYKSIMLEPIFNCKINKYLQNTISLVICHKYIATSSIEFF